MRPPRLRALRAVSLAETGRTRAPIVFPPTKRSNLGRADPNTKNIYICARNTENGRTAPPANSDEQMFGESSARDRALAAHNYRASACMRSALSSSPPPPPLECGSASRPRFVINCYGYINEFEDRAEIKRNARASASGRDCFQDLLAPARLYTCGPRIGENPA